MSAKSSKKPSQKVQPKKGTTSVKTTKTTSSGKHVGDSKKSIANKRMAAEIPPKTKKGAVKKGKK